MIRLFVSNSFCGIGSWKNLWKIIGGIVILLFEVLMVYNV